MKAGNLSLSTFLGYAEKPLAFLRRYLVIIILLVVLGTYGFLVWQIRTYNSMEPSDDEVAEKLGSVALPKIDKDVVEQLKQLEDNNVQVKTLFDQTRDNPFQE
jgi:hypothetical protein